MFTARASLLTVLVAVGLFAALQAQAPTTPPLTNAQLQAKVAVLEHDLANLQGDYTALVTNCSIAQTTAAQDAAAALERAAAARQQVAFDANAKLEQLRQDQALDDASWFVSKLDYGVTESNSVFLRFGWKVTIKNSIPRTQAFDLTVQFLDKNDLVIDTARLYGQTIAGSDEQTISGDKLISMPGALLVAKARAIAARKNQ